MEFYSSLDINEIKRGMTLAINNDWMKADTLRGNIKADRFGCVNGPNTFNETQLPDYFMEYYVPKALEP